MQKISLNLSASDFGHLQGMLERDMQRNQRAALAVAGGRPTATLVRLQIRTVRVYRGLMREWVRVVRGGARQ